MGEILVGLLIGGAKLQLKASKFLQLRLNSADIFPRRAVAYSLSAVSSAYLQTLVRDTKEAQQLRSTNFILPL